MATDPFRAEIAGRFDEAIRNHRISKAQAARDLRVSRQMLYQYLAGKSLPKHDVLRRACEVWKLQLNYKEFIVTATSFPQPERQRPMTQPKQLDLLAAVEALRNEDLDLKILRKTNGRIELKLELRLGLA
jgi:transcriptional regulator with XRE-family HTH domain